MTAVYANYGKHIAIKTMHSKSNMIFFATFLFKILILIFKSPAINACSMCISFKGLISATYSEVTKLKLIQKLRIHKLKAKYFYNSLQYFEENILKISFDC